MSQDVTHRTVMLFRSISSKPAFSSIEFFVPPCVSDSNLVSVLQSIPSYLEVFHVSKIRNFILFFVMQPLRINWSNPVLIVKSIQPLLGVFLAVSGFDACFWFGGIVVVPVTVCLSSGEVFCAISRCGCSFFLAWPDQAKWYVEYQFDPLFMCDRWWIAFEMSHMIGIITY